MFYRFLITHDPCISVIINPDTLHTYIYILPYPVKRQSCHGHLMVTQAGMRAQGWAFGGFFVILARGWQLPLARWGFGPKT